MPNKYHAFDARLEHRAIGAAALTATTVLATIDERAQHRTSYRTLAIVEAIKISANNELYQLVVEVSNDNFTTVETAAIRDLGATEVRARGAKDSAVADEVEMIWTTEVAGVKYQQSRVVLVISGTSPSIQMGCYSTVAKDV